MCAKENQETIDLFVLGSKLVVSVGMSVVSMARGKGSEGETELIRLESLCLTRSCTESYSEISRWVSWLVRGRVMI